MSKEEVTKIETTDGVTREAITFASIVEEFPITTAVLFEGQVPLVARYRTFVLLSEHAVIDGVGLIAAVATVPAIAIPATNAITGLKFFMS